MSDILKAAEMIVAAIDRNTAALKGVRLQTYEEYTDAECEALGIYCRQSGEDGICEHNEGYGCTFGSDEGDE